jgi:hypothetical protein
MGIKWVNLYQEICDLIDMEFQVKKQGKKFYLSSLNLIFYVKGTQKDNNDDNSNILLYIYKIF